jgi:hypothetical protein
MTALPHLVPSKMGHKYQVGDSKKTLIASAAEMADAVVLSIKVRCLKCTKN